MDYKLLSLEKANHLIHNSSPEAWCGQAGLAAPH